jgi:hypothetical protein
MSRTASDAKRALNRVLAYEQNQHLVLRDEVARQMEAANEMVRLGNALTAYRGRLSKKAVVTAGSTLGSITLTVEGDETLLDDIRKAKNTAFRLANRFAANAAANL